MSRDQQIEEMVIALTESQHDFDRAWHECLHNKGKQPERENVFYAKFLIEKKGYRKASEVAREIFEEIESIVDKRTAWNGNIYSLLLKRDFAELKKKYTEEGE